MDTTPLYTMHKMLSSLKESEILLNEAIAQFENFPSKQKNGSKRMDDLLKALLILQKNQFNIPIDWRESQWWHPDYETHLSIIQDDLK